MKIKNPILNSIIHTVLFFVIFNVICFIVGFLFNFAGINNKIVLMVFSGLLLFAVYVLVYRNKFKKLVTLDKFKLGLIMGIPVLFLIFLPMLVDSSFTLSDFNFSLYGIGYAILGGLGPGLSEEIMFRGALINSFMEKIEKEKFIPLAVLLSAIIFSLIHSFNVFAGADLNQTILQLIYTFGFGSLLAAIYLRTGNILIVIFWHSFMDFIAYLNINIANTGGILTTELNLLAPSQLVTIIISIIMVVCAFYYVRSKKYNEIMELWNLKKI